MFPIYLSVRPLFILIRNQSLHTPHQRVESGLKLLVYVEKNTPLTTRSLLNKSFKDLNQAFPDFDQEKLLLTLKWKSGIRLKY